ncbi:MAG: FtsW/RodA/SpoVE family cell cycle protein, partial [Salinisphaera sp.]|nr:FtsW/RodA/SpoVE family cell cycle protein [Salinisphaera sp.]
MSATSAEQERPVTLAQWLYYWKIDLPLLLALLGCGAISVFLLYSASDQSMGMVFNQSMRFGIGLAAMVAVAQVPPDWYRTAAPWAYGGGLLLLVLVLCFGDTANGATSWLVVGPLRFQPSEIMKIAVPLAAAAWLHERVLPPSWAALGITALLVAVPVVL